MSEPDKELNWIDVEGPIWSEMPAGPHVLVIYTREGLQVIRNVEPPYRFETREQGRWTRIHFAALTFEWRDVVRIIVWKP